MSTGRYSVFFLLRPTRNPSLSLSLSLSPLRLQISSQLRHRGENKIAKASKGQNDDSNSGALVIGAFRHRS